MPTNVASDPTSSIGSSEQAGDQPTTVISYRRSSEPLVLRQNTQQEQHSLNGIASNQHQNKETKQSPSRTATHLTNVASNITSSASKNTSTASNLVKNNTGNVTSNIETPSYSKKPPSSAAAHTLKRISSTGSISYTSSACISARSKPTKSVHELIKAFGETRSKSCEPPKTSAHMKESQTSASASVRDSGRNHDSSYLIDRSLDSKEKQDICSNKAINGEQKSSYEEQIESGNENKVKQKLQQENIEDKLQFTERHSAPCQDNPRPLNHHENGTPYYSTDEQNETQALQNANQLPSSKEEQTKNEIKTENHSLNDTEQLNRGQKEQVFIESKQQHATKCETCPSRPPPFLRRNESLPFDQSVLRRNSESLNKSRYESFREAREKIQENKGNVPRKNSAPDTLCIKISVRDLVKKVYETNDSASDIDKPTLSHLQSSQDQANSEPKLQVNGTKQHAIVYKPLPPASPSSASIHESKDDTEITTDGIECEDIDGVDYVKTSADTLLDSTVKDFENQTSRSSRSACDVTFDSSQSTTSSLTLQDISNSISGTETEYQTSSESVSVSKQECKDSETALVVDSAEIDKPTPQENGHVHTDYAEKSAINLVPEVNGVDSTTVFSQELSTSVTSGNVFCSSTTQIGLREIKTQISISPESVDISTTQAEKCLHPQTSEPHESESTEYRHKQTSADSSGSSVRLRDLSTFGNQRRQSVASLISRFSPGSASGDAQQVQKYSLDKESTNIAAAKRRQHNHRHRLSLPTPERTIIPKESQPSTKAYLSRSNSLKNVVNKSGVDRMSDVSTPDDSMIIDHAEIERLLKESQERRRNKLKTRHSWSRDRSTDILPSSHLNGDSNQSEDILVLNRSNHDSKDNGILLEPALLQVCQTMAEDLGSNCNRHDETELNSKENQEVSEGSQNNQHGQLNARGAIEQSTAPVTFHSSPQLAARSVMEYTSKIEKSVDHHSRDVDKNLELPGSGCSAHTESNMSKSNRVDFLMETYSKAQVKCTTTIKTLTGNNVDSIYTEAAMYSSETHETFMATELSQTQKNLARKPPPAPRRNYSPSYETSMKMNTRTNFDFTVGSTGHNGSTVNSSMNTASAVVKCNTTVDSRKNINRLPIDIPDGSENVLSSLQEVRVPPVPLPRKRKNSPNNLDLASRKNTNSPVHPSASDIELVKASIVADLRETTCCNVETPLLDGNKEQEDSFKDCVNLKEPTKADTGEDKSNDSLLTQDSNRAHIVHPQLPSLGNDLETDRNLVLNIETQTDKTPTLSPVHHGEIMNAHSQNVENEPLKPFENIKSVSNDSRAVQTPSPNKDPENTVSRSEELETESMSKGNQDTWVTANSSLSVEASIAGDSCIYETNSPPPNADTVTVYRNKDGGEEIVETNITDFEQNALITPKDNKEAMCSLDQTVDHLKETEQCGNTVKEVMIVDVGDKSVNLQNESQRKGHVIFLNGYIQTTVVSTNSTSDHPTKVNNTEHKGDGRRQSVKTPPPVNSDRKDDFSYGQFLNNKQTFTPKLSADNTRRASTGSNVEQHIMEKTAARSSIKPSPEANLEQNLNKGLSQVTGGKEITQRRQLLQDKTDQRSVVSNGQSSTHTTKKENNGVIDTFQKGNRDVKQQKTMNTSSENIDSPRQRKERIKDKLDSVFNRLYFNNRKTKTVCEKFKDNKAKESSSISSPRRKSLGTGLNSSSKRNSISKEEETHSPTCIRSSVAGAVKERHSLHPVSNTVMGPREVYELTAGKVESSQSDAKIKPPLKQWTASSKSTNSPRTVKNHTPISPRHAFGTSIPSPRSPRTPSEKSHIIRKFNEKTQCADPPVNPLKPWKVQVSPASSEFHGEGNILNATPKGSDPPERFTTEPQHPLKTSLSVRKSSKDAVAVPSHNTFIPMCSPGHANEKTSGLKHSSKEIAGRWAPSIRFKTRSPIPPRNGSCENKSQRKSSVEKSSDVNTKLSSNHRSLDQQNGRGSISNSDARTTSNQEFTGMSFTRQHLAKTGQLPSWAMNNCDNIEANNRPSQDYRFRPISNNPSRRSSDTCSISSEVENINDAKTCSLGKQNATSHGRSKESHGKTGSSIRKRHSLTPRVKPDENGVSNELCSIDNKKCEDFSKAVVVNLAHKARKPSDGTTRRFSMPATTWNKYKGPLSRSERLKALKQEHDETLERFKRFMRKQEELGEVTEYTEVTEECTEHVEECCIMVNSVEEAERLVTSITKSSGKPGKSHVALYNKYTSRSKESSPVAQEIKAVQNCFDKEGCMQIDSIQSRDPLSSSGGIRVSQNEASHERHEADVTSNKFSSSFKSPTNTSFNCVLANEMIELTNADDQKLNSAHEFSHFVEKPAQMGVSSVNADNNVSCPTKEDGGYHIVQVLSPRPLTPIQILPRDSPEETFTKSKTVEIIEEDLRVHNRKKESEEEDLRVHNRKKESEEEDLRVHNRKKESEKEDVCDRVLNEKFNLQKSSVQESQKLLHCESVSETDNDSKQSSIATYNTGFVYRSNNLNEIKHFVGTVPIGATHSKASSENIKEENTTRSVTEETESPIEDANDHNFYTNDKTKQNPIQSNQKQHTVYNEREQGRESETTTNNKSRDNFKDSHSEQPPVSDVNENRPLGFCLKRPKHHPMNSQPCKKELKVSGEKNTYQNKAFKDETETCKFQGQKMENVPKPQSVINADLETSSSILLQGKVQDWNSQTTETLGLSGSNVSAEVTSTFCSKSEDSADTLVSDFVINNVAHIAGNLVIDSPLPQSLKVTADDQSNVIESELPEVQLSFAEKVKMYLNIEEQNEAEHKKYDTTRRKNSKLKALRSETFIKESSVSDSELLDNSSSEATGGLCKAPKAVCSSDKSLKAKEANIQVDLDEIWSGDMRAMASQTVHRASKDAGTDTPACAGQQSLRDVLRRKASSSLNKHQSGYHSHEQAVESYVARLQAGKDDASVETSNACHGGFIQTKTVAQGNKDAVHDEVESKMWRQARNATFIKNIQSIDQRVSRAGKVSESMEVNCTLGDKEQATHNDTATHALCTKDDGAFIDSGQRGIDAVSILPCSEKSTQKDDCVLKRTVSTNKEVLNVLPSGDQVDLSSASEKTLGSDEMSSEITCMVPNIRESRNDLYLNDLVKGACASLDPKGSTKEQSSGDALQPHAKTKPAKTSVSQAELEQLISNLDLSADTFDSLFLQNVQYLKDSSLTGLALGDTDVPSTLPLKRRKTASSAVGMGLSGVRSDPQPMLRRRTVVGNVWSKTQQDTGSRKPEPKLPVCTNQR